MIRPSSDEYYSAIALMASLRGTCSRRKVGCVLVDKRGFVLATGYNGVPRGVAHCTQIKCPGADLPSGQGLNMCYATHGEQNALLQCRDTELIHTAYCTASPCITCVKLLMNTGCQRIVYQEEYPHPESKNLWIMAGRDWIQMPANNLIELFRVASERSESAQTKSQGG